MAALPPTTSTTTTATMTTTITPFAPLVTASVITTETSIINASVVTSCTTFWEYYYTTITATHGQTITFRSPTISTTAAPPSIPTTKINPESQPTITSTVTSTEIAIYLQSPSATTVYSTWTLPLTSTLPPQVSNANQPGSFLYVVSPGPTGWESWSTGAKAGLIIGVTAAAILLLLFLWCCCKRMRNNEWIAHDWRWARNVEGGPAPGANTVPTVQVNGALDRRYATPYGYGAGGGYGGGYGQQEHPGWVWMRGGDGEQCSDKRLIRRLRGWTGRGNSVLADMFEADTQAENDLEHASGMGKPENRRLTSTEKSQLY